MKKPLKITIISVAVLLAVIIGISLFLRSYLTDEKIRTLITEVAEKSLNRKVMIGDIRVSLFKGIVVKDFEIRERDSEQSFIRTKDFILKYQLIPLLAKRLVIDTLSVVEPEVHLKKKPDGSYNFSDITKTGEHPDQKDRKEVLSGLPVDLNVKSITIKDAKIDYSDPDGKLKKADVIMNAELGMSGLSSKALSSQGDFSFTVKEALLKDGKQPIKNITSDITYKIGMDMASRKITIHSLDADIMKIPLSIQGTVDYAGEAAFSLDLKVKDMDLSNTRGISSKFLPDGMALDGTVFVFLNIIKQPLKESPLSFDGNIKMTRVSFTHKGIHPVLDGSLKFSPETITFENLKLIAGQNSADVTGSVRNYRKYPELSVGIRSSFLDLDNLFVPVPSSQKKEQTAKAGGAEKEPGPMNLKLKVNASLDIDKTSFKGIAITNFRSHYELKDNIFRITRLNGNTLKGGFALRAAVDLTQKGSRYSMNADLNGIKVEDLVNVLAPKAKDKLSGTLYGKAGFSGAGTLPESIKRNLKGKGSFSITDGVVKNAEVGTGLLAFLGLQELKEIPIQQAEGRFTVADGLVNLISLISSKDLILDEKGTVGLDEKLDIGIVAKVSERLTPMVVGQSAISRFLSEEKGWTSVPLRVGGTISKPSYTIDTRAVGKKAAETIQKQIGEELFKSMSKDKEKPAGSERKKGPDPQDLIKGLFGR